jgi:hypothetical protein
MKISFDVGIQGFERVSRVLQDQQKLINDNAQAFNNLTGAKAALGKTEVETKGFESIKASAVGINDLVKAFDTLTRSQSGLQGFMGLFGQFNKQLADFSRESSTSIFKGMQNQVAELKKSVTDTTSLVDNAKSRAAAFRVSGDTNLAIAWDQEAARQGVAGITQQNMLNTLQRQTFMRTPISQLMGVPGQIMGLEGGPSIMGLMGGAAKIGSGVMIGSYIGNQIMSASEQAYYAPEKAAASTFQQQMSIAQQAASGSTGRSFMLSNRIGLESQYVNGPVGTWGQIRAGFQAGINPMNWPTIATNPQAVFDQYEVKKRNELAEYDQPTSARFGMGQNVIQSMFASEGYTNLERVMGLNTTRRGVAANLLGGGDISRAAMPAEEAMKYIGAISMYGGSALTGNGQAAATVRAAEYRETQARGAFGDATRSGDAELLRKATESLERAVREVAEARLSASGSVQRLGRYYNMSDRAINEQARQEFYNPNAAMDIGRAYGAAFPGPVRAGTPEAMQMYGDFITKLQQGNQIGETDTGVAAMPAADIMARLQSIPGKKYDEPAIAAAGIQGQQAATGTISNPASMQGTAFRMSLMRLGVTSPGMIANITTLMQSGQTDKAIALIKADSKRSGLTDDQIHSGINDPQAAYQKLVGRIMFNTKDQKAMESVTGLSGQDFLLGGGQTPTALAYHTTHGAILAQATKIPYADIAPPPKPPLPPTSAEIGATEKGTAQAQMVGATESLISGTGKDVGETIARAVAQGFTDMAAAIVKGIHAAPPVGTPITHTAPTTPKPNLGLKPNPGKGN